MALAHVDFFSEVLGLCCQIDVILPQKLQGIGQDAANRVGDAPVLWLLHGASDDHTIWQRRTSIEHYVAPLGIAVVMPAVQLSFYTNMEYGGRYFDYITAELPAIMRDFFHFSARREDNYVAGLSMGGYGAFKVALTKPEQYAAAASLSGALDIASLFGRRAKDPGIKQDPQRANLMKMIFGSNRSLRGTQHDLLHLLDQHVANQTDLPALYVTCGTEDYLYTDNITFREHAKRLGVPLTYHEEPGVHEWGYWDRNIQKILAWLPLPEKPAPPEA
jgi:S-formylglutathione hydrolase FrmB